MVDPLDKTFATLAATTNVHAADVLIGALDVRNEAIRQRAVRTILKRNSTRGHVELIRRLSSLPSNLRHLVTTEGRSLSGALRQCLIHGETELKLNSLAIICETENFAQIPTVVELLTADAPECHDAAAETTYSLVEKLYEYLNADPSGEAGSPSVHNIVQLRANMLSSFDNACAEFDSLVHPRVIIESILILGEPGDFAVKRALWQGSPACRKLGADILKKSTHPGVIRLICSFLGEHYPHPKAIEAIATRTDPEFIHNYLRWFPTRPSQTQIKNLKQITEVAWLNPTYLAADAIPAELQEALVTMVNYCGLPSEHKARLREWLVRHGSNEGREAAGDVLLSLDEGAARDVILSSLDADDPNVQAWATSKLRSQGIPEAFKILLDRLDSPMEEVREAARSELSGFNLETLLGLFEHLSPSMALRCGALVQKVDPSYESKLLKELASPIRRRRILAARASVSLGLQRQALPGLLAMLEDADAHVRRTGVEALVGVEDQCVVLALKRLLEDPSPRVKESANRVLQNLSVTPVTTPLSGNTSIDVPTYGKP